MIDKTLVKRRFERSLKTYNDNAEVQKRMAERLISMLPRLNFNSVLEIGSGTGIFTQKAAEKINYKEYCCIDLAAGSEKYIKKIIPDAVFKAGDIEEIELKKKYDLIISNAALQWCSDTAAAVNKLFLNLHKDGVLAFSIFGNDNFKELKEILNLKNIIETDIKGIEETEILYFANPLDVLRHIKYTGANALMDFKFTKSSLKKFIEEYKNKMLSDGRIPLTYKPLYSVTIRRGIQP